MRVGGQDLITERTEKSSRFLLTSSATVFLIRHYNVPIEDLSVFGVKAPAALFDSVALVIVSYSLMNFLVHWVGDMVSWSIWYKENKIETTDGDVPRGSFHDQSIESLEKEIEGGANIQRNNLQVEEVMNMIRGYNWRVNSIYWYGWLYIAGLHFVVPVGASITALLSLRI